MVLVPLSKRKGLFLFGGYLKQSLNSTMSDEKTQYLARCKSTITAAGLRLSDAFTTAWYQKYNSTQDSCFATVPDFLVLENQFTISDKMWTYLESYCKITDLKYGSCFWGRSKCSAGYFGPDCSQKQCMNSFCYQEKTSLQEAVCIHCFGRGQCVNGMCQCDNGFTSDDCSAIGCPNNCSNNGTQIVATCISSYPLSVCECFQETKRGGDDCSFIFCLNDCGGHGTCVNGECQCDSNYYGLDCSIFDIDFIDQSSFGKLTNLGLFYLLVLVIIISI